MTPAAALQRFFATLSFLVAFAMFVSPAVALDEGLSEYVVKRNGEPIGTLKINLKKNGERLIATSDYSIKVKLLAIVLYRYDKKMVEIYENGRLVAYETDIDDNGTKSRMTVARAGEKLAITSPKGSLTVPNGLIPTTYWPPKTVTQRQMIGSSDGILVNVSPSTPVSEDLKMDGRTLKTNRYEITGDLKRDLWYDAGTGHWLKMKLIASDDSVIEIERDWPPVWKRNLL